MKIVFYYYYYFSKRKMMRHDPLNRNDIEKRVRDYKDLYIAISRVYYLPTKSSTAVNLEYLRKYLEEEPKLFTIERRIIMTYEFRYRGKHAKFLLGYLERILKDKRLYPTGFDLFNTPDIEWLKTVILNLEPEDKLGLLAVSYPGWGIDEKLEIEREVLQINPL